MAARDKRVNALAETRLVTPNSQQLMAEDTERRKAPVSSPIQTRKGPEKRQVDVSRNVSPNFQMN